MSDHPGSTEREDLMAQLQTYGFSAPHCAKIPTEDLRRMLETLRAPRSERCGTERLEGEGCEIPPVPYR